MAAEHMLTIPYSEELLLSLKASPVEFEAEARLLLAVKLYELGGCQPAGPRNSRG
jgi:hypothetical protein